MSFLQTTQRKFATLSAFLERVLEEGIAVVTKHPWTFLLIAALNLLFVMGYAKIRANLIQPAIEHYLGEGNLSFLISSGLTSLPSGGTIATWGALPFEKTYLFALFRVMLLGFIMTLVLFLVLEGIVYYLNFLLSPKKISLMTFMSRFVRVNLIWTALLALGIFGSMVFLLYNKAVYSPQLVSDAVVNTIEYVLLAIWAYFMLMTNALLNTSTPLRSGWRASLRESWRLLPLFALIILGFFALHYLLKILFLNAGLTTEIIIGMILLPLLMAFSQISIINGANIVEE
ncbi:hypothetical protein HZB01_04390 [Candidatus Woesearchaeota archaeon]|nr:hypothetical protein [Candidatus Woesearchaeota archaeon]